MIMMVFDGSSRGGVVLMLLVMIRYMMAWVLLVVVLTVVMMVHRMAWWTNAILVVAAVVIALIENKDRVKVVYIRKKKHDVDETSKRGGNKRRWKLNKSTRAAENESKSRRQTEKWHILTSKAHYHIIWLSIHYSFDLFPFLFIELIYF